MRFAIALASFVGVTLIADGALESVAAPHHQNTTPQPTGHPDLNGVWQVMNTANWDIEPHAARAALALRAGPFGPVPAKEVVALGAVGSVPAGLGVVEGGTIPYTPAALAAKKDNQAHWLERDPEI